MGLLADVFSYGDGLKRKLGGLLSDPGGTIDLGVRRFAEDQDKLLELQRTAYPMAGDKSVLQDPQQQAQARSQLAQQATDAYGGLLGSMQGMGLERGWYRGGPKIVDGKRSGPMYTRDADEAAGYAKRFGDGGEVREYAIPSGGYLNADMGYSSRLAHDVASILDGAYYGKQGGQLAAELRTFGPNEQIPGNALWQALESRFGNDGASEVIDKLGVFKGVRGVTRGDEAIVFKRGAVRDALKAKFDPAKYNDDDIYGAATVPFMGLLAGSSLAGLGILNSARQGQGDEEKTSLPRPHP